MSIRPKGINYAGIMARLGPMLNTTFKQERDGGPNYFYSADEHFTIESCEERMETAMAYLEKYGLYFEWVDGYTLALFPID